MPVNEISSFKVSNEVTISNASDLQTMLENVNTVIELIDEAKTLQEDAKNNSVKWKGKAKEVYDSFNDFLRYYNQDLREALTGYKKMLSTITSELADLKEESNAIKKLENVSQI